MENEVTIADYLKRMSMEEAFDRDGFRRIIEKLFSDPGRQALMMHFQDSLELHRLVFNTNLEKNKDAGLQLVAAVKLLSEQNATLVQEVDSMHKEVGLLKTMMGGAK